MRVSWYKAVAGVIVVAVLGACTRTDDRPKEAEDVLTTYISRSFNADRESDKGLLLELTTDRLRDAISALREEEFRKKYLETKRQFLKLRILQSQRITEDEMQFTFELSFKEKKDFEAKITQKQIAILRKTAGSWLIAEVRGIKELVEYDEGLNVMGVVR